MRILGYVLLGILGLVVSLLALLWLYFSFIHEEPVGVNPEQAFRDYPIQPQEALRLAEPHLAAQATRVWRERPEDVRTHIVYYKKHYYISRANYPAKTLNYYLRPAVKVHVKTGQLSFSEEA